MRPEQKTPGIRRMNWFGAERMLEKKHKETMVGNKPHIEGPGCLVTVGSPLLWKSIHHFQLLTDMGVFAFSFWVSSL